MCAVLLPLLLSSLCFFFFFSSRRRHTRSDRDWSSDVCSSDLAARTYLCARPKRPPTFSRDLHATTASRSTNTSSPTEWGDRKSTRLNSSHDQISYAVFCLKKKKKKKKKSNVMDKK